MAVPNEIVNKFKAKYQHLSEFFQFIGVNSTKVKDTYQIIFKCKKCLPQKEVKANNRALTSNLKSHVKTNHPFIMSKFFNLKIFIASHLLHFFRKFIAILQYFNKPKSHCK